MNITTKKNQQDFNNFSGSEEQVAMHIYNALKQLDSSNKLIYQLKSVPGFQFVITKEKI